VIVSKSFYVCINLNFSEHFVCVGHLAFVFELIFPGFRELFRKSILLECNQIFLEILTSDVKFIHLAADLEFILTLCLFTFLVVALLLL
jgi:hypothetical protein